MSLARPASERVIAAGQSESGKTAFLRRHFLTRAPRLIIVDRTGEYFATEHGAPQCHGLRDLVATLEDFAGRGRWRIVCDLSNDEVGQLASVLTGIPNARTGYSFNVGGVGIVLPEVDLLVPVTMAPEAIRSMWRRGSHAGLSVYADTQRPANVSKEVTSQCRWIVFLALYEPRDSDYMLTVLGRTMGGPALTWTRQRRYNAALLDQRARTVHLLDPNGRVIRSISERDGIPQDIERPDA